MHLNLKVVLLPAGHVLLPGMTLRLRAAPLDDTPEISPKDRAALDKEFGTMENTVLAVLPRDLNGSPNMVGVLAQIDSNENGLIETKGLCRLQVEELDSAHGTCTAETIREHSEIDPELFNELKSSWTTLLEPMGPAGKALTQRFVSYTGGVSSPSLVVDLIATLLPLKNKEKLRVLEERDPTVRAKFLTQVIKEQTNKASMAFFRQSKIPHKKAIGSGSPGSSNEEDEELAALEKTLIGAPLCSEGRRTVDRELRKIKRMNSQQAEYNVMRTYLETIADIPWSDNKIPPLDNQIIQGASEQLNNDHYGLEKVKKRLLEYLAVLYLQQKRGKSTSKSPILCLVGPPGVGKTSLAQSIARAINRPLHRISLGGVRDEAEIRGHRRTYIGAMPGIFVNGLRKARSMNPVFVLDEIDKVGQGSHSVHGDPSAALLEVLDPEQNSTFTDHYVGFPVDLSNILFIATANSIDQMPRPLLDRMEVIHVDGYTYLEKQHIAQNHLLPKQIDQNALDPAAISVPNPTIDYIATHYTRESGVRNLNRQLGTLCRGRAVEVLNDKEYRKSIEIEDLPRYLGLESFHDDMVNDEVDLVERNGKPQLRETPGVVNGLAYMGSGNGGLLVFEATFIPNGSGKLKLTGKLGDVISESAQIAMSWVHAHAYELGIEMDLNKVDVHLHAPAGAIPKDGPSAGVAMTVCLVSLFSNKAIPRDIAMTGEMTLRGKILPVGGIREKLLGAHMAGVRHIILPYHCRPVVEEEAGFVKDLEIQIDYVKYVWDVLALIWPENQQFREPIQQSVL